MATRTLTPASTTSSIVLPATGSTANVTASLPLGIYSEEEVFISGASDQVAYVYQKLGGETLNIELTEGQVYSAYEDSVLEYSYIVNIHQAKNTLSNVLGNSTGSFDQDGRIIAGDALSGSHVELKYPKWEFSYARRVAAGIASETGLGGEKRIYSASIDIEQGIQDYDLQTIISSSALTDGIEYQNKVGNKRIMVTKVFYKTPHAMWRFYGYYGGLNTVGDLASYGQFADDSTFEVIPAWQNKLQAMAFEDAIWTRNSHYSYELKNNRLRLYPRPVRQSPSKIWVEFFLQTDGWIEEEENKNSGIDGINNLNTLPFENIPFKSINSIGKQWIRRFALALSKEMLGYTRSKFGSIPIPGESVTLNGTDLVSQGKAEQDSLREELKTVLDETTYQKLMESDQVLVEATNKIQEKIPLPVIVG